MRNILYLLEKIRVIFHYIVDQFQQNFYVWKNPREVLIFIIEILLIMIYEVRTNHIIIYIPAKICVTFCIYWKKSASLFHYVVDQFQQNFYIGKNPREVLIFIIEILLIMIYEVRTNHIII